MALSNADMAKMPGIDDKMMATLKDLSVQHCKDDKWSEDTVKCMSDAKTQAEAQGCYGKMTQQQQQKMNKAMLEMTPPQGGGGMGVPVVRRPLVAVCTSSQAASTPL